MQGCAGAAFHGLNRLACAVQSSSPGEQADALAYWACRWWPAPVSRSAAAGLSLQALATRAAEAYARSGHHTALQLVTSAQALRVLLPFLAGDDGQATAALAAYGCAFDCAWGVVPQRPSPTSAALPWAAITARAVASNDADTIELVAACREQHAAYGGAVWQLAATRAVATLS